jgi:hypothetical protein
MQHLSSYPHTVRLPISRAVLGRRFEDTFQRCRFAAGILAKHDFYLQAVYENYERVGYLFGFRKPLMVARLCLYHQSVIAGRPFPLKIWL